MAQLSGCIVVKNGKGSIQKCLDALLPLVNEYIIVDTGSTDGTLELVDEWKRRHSSTRLILDRVGTRFHDSDGIFDFGAAKDYAISIATCEYVLWCDVNDVCAKPREVRAAFEKIVAKYPFASITMNTKVTASFAFPRVRIAPRQYAKFVGRIHEYMSNTAPDGDPRKQLVTTRFCMENYKSYRDIARNVKGLEKEWTEHRSQRTAFYMGNSYKDIRDYRTAGIWYAITVDEFPTERTEERFKALETLCDISIHHVDWNELGVRSMQMIEERPNRPEGYYYRAKYNYNTSQFRMAKKCLDNVIRLLRTGGKVETNLWLNAQIYDKNHILGLQAELNAALQYAEMDPIQPEYIGNSMPPGVGM